MATGTRLEYENPVSRDRARADGAHSGHRGACSGGHGASSSLWDETEGDRGGEGGVDS